MLTQEMSRMLKQLGEEAKIELSHGNDVSEASENILAFGRPGDDHAALDALRKLFDKSNDELNYEMNALGGEAPYVICRVLSQK